MTARDRTELVILTSVVVVLVIVVLLMSDNRGITALAILTAAPFCLTLGYFMHR